jgi:hypothetical protein
VVGDTTGARNHGHAGCCGGGQPNLVYAFRAPADGAYRAETNVFRGGLNTILFVRSACAFYDPAFELGCNVRLDDPNVIGSRVEFEATAGQEVYLFVDADYNWQEGQFTLTVSRL